MIYFAAKNFREKIVRKIIDHRITETATVDAVGKGCKSLIVVIYYADWKKAIYVLGRRLK
jgi:hypothetical protein